MLKMCQSSWMSQYTSWFISYGKCNYINNIKPFFVFFPYRFYVDGTPIREFKNKESIGIPFPKRQPMKLQSSLWNADDWATRGGRVKTDWTQAPFTATYRNFEANQACIWSVSGSSSCRGGSSEDDSWLSQQLDSAGSKRLKWVQRNYMVYNYCSDFKRFPRGLPLECTVWCFVEYE